MRFIQKITSIVFLAIALSTTQAHAQVPFIGEIRMFAGNFAPRGWAFCDGQFMAISQNSALFSIVGTMYGGDGRTTFALPDLRGRTPIGTGRGPGLQDYRQGSRGGAENITLTTAQIPTHNHVVLFSNNTSTTINSTNSAVRETPIAGDVPAVPEFGDGLSTTKVKAYGPKPADPAETVETTTTNNSTATTLNNGGNQSFNNRQPYLPIRYIIALQGSFPTRS